MPSLRSWLAQGTVVTTFSAAAFFAVYTKHCHFEPVPSNASGIPLTTPAANPIFQSRFYKTFNPRDNPVLHDLCVRKIPLFKVRRELVEDAERGGGRLVEAFVGGVWGDFGCLIQRAYLSRKYSTDPPTSAQLYTQPALLSSSYEEGTDVLNHFTVVSKTPTSIIFRAGDSPLASPGGPRESDGLLELTAKADLDKGFAEFTFRSVFYNGTESGAANAPMGPGMAWAHRMYTKLLVESGMKNCMS